MQAQYIYACDSNSNIISDRALLLRLVRGLVYWAVVRDEGLSGISGQVWLLRNQHHDQMEQIANAWNLKLIRWPGGPFQLFDSASQAIGDYITNVVKSTLGLSDQDATEATNATVYVWQVLTSVADTNMMWSPGVVTVLENHGIVPQGLGDVVTPDWIQFQLSQKQPDDVHLLVKDLIAQGTIDGYIHASLGDETVRLIGDQIVKAAAQVATSFIATAGISYISLNMSHGFSEQIIEDLAYQHGMEAGAQSAAAALNGLLIAFIVAEVHWIADRTKDVSTLLDAADSTAEFITSVGSEYDRLASIDGSTAFNLSIEDSTSLMIQLAEAYVECSDNYRLYNMIATAPLLGVVGNFVDPALGPELDGDAKDANSLAAELYDHLGALCDVVLPKITTSPAAIIKGTVRDAVSGLGIGNAKVWISNSEPTLYVVTTDPQGFYISPNLEPTTWSVSAVASGYLAGSSVSVTTQPAQTSNYDMTLTQQDLNSPTISISSPPSTTTSASVTFSGTAHDNVAVASVDVSKDAAAWSAASGTMHEPDVSWSSTMSLTPGTNVLYVRATDSQGNQTVNSRTVTMTPSGPLTLSFTSPADYAVIGGSTGQIDVHGTSSGAVTVRGPGGKPILPDPTFPPNWKCGVSLSSGYNSLQFEAIDAQSNILSATLHLIYDNSNPTCTITSPTDQQRVTTDHINLAGAASDNIKVADVRYRNTALGSSWSTASGTEQWHAYVALWPGSNEIDAYAEDLVHNTSSTKTIIVYYDTQNPTVSITSHADHQLVNTSTIMLAGTASDNDAVAQVDVSVNGGAPVVASGTTAWSAQVSLNGGTNTLTARATDKSGRVATQSITLECDASSPNIDITSPADQAVVTATPVTVTGTSSDDDSVSDVEISVNGGPYSPVSGLTTWTASAALGAGANIIQARATDKAGNPSFATATVYLDTSAPTVAITSPADGSHVATSSLDITGTAHDADTSISLVEVSVNGAAYQPVAAAESWQATVPLVPGANTITARATDMAGRQSSPASITVTQAPKANVLFSQYAATGTPGGTVMLKTLVYSGGAPAPGLTVQFAVDGIAAGSAISDSKCAACSYTIPTTMTAGPHNVTVTFAGDATHNPSSRTTAALTVKLNVFFSQYAASGAAATTITLKSLVYSGGVPTSGLAVNFYVDSNPVGAASPSYNLVGSAVSTATDAELPWTIPASMAAGVHNVSVSFAGDATHNAGTRTTPALTVGPLKANVAFSLYVVTAYPGQPQPVTLKSLMYSGGTPLVGKLVDWYVDDVYVGTSTSGTDNVSLSYTIPTSMSLGAHKVEVKFAGDAAYKPASGHENALTVELLKANVLFSLYAVSGSPGYHATLKSLMYSGGKPLSSKSVDWYVDDGYVGTSISGASSVSFDYIIPTSMPLGLHTVKVVFGGDGAYKAASGSEAALKVVAPPTGGIGGIIQ